MEQTRVENWRTMEVEPIHHRVPRQLQFVDELSKTSTGKIMRRRLRELDGESQPK